MSNQKTLLALTIVLASATASGQEHTAKNAVHLEGLGGGILYTLNYERLVIDPLAVRLGFSYFAFSASSTSSGETTDVKATYLMFPITASYVGLYSGSHALEVGTGATVSYVSAAASNLGLSAEASGITAFGTVHLGYRIHPLDGGFMFRVGAMLLYGPGFGGDTGNPTWGVLPWGYLSLGYAM